MPNNATALARSGRIVVLGTAALVTVFLSIGIRNVWSQQPPVPHAANPAAPIVSSPTLIEPRADQMVPYAVDNAPQTLLSPAVISSQAATLTTPQMSARMSTQPVAYAGQRRSRCCGSRASQGYRSPQVVERHTGIPGMRVTEWRSHHTGLTLSEERRAGIIAISASSPIEVKGDCGPCGVEFPSAPILDGGGAYLNIPDSVW